MSKVLLVVGMLVAGGLCWWALHNGHAQSAGKRDGSRPLEPHDDAPPEERVARARKKEATLRKRCEAVGVNYPPAELYLRAFKQETELEVWGREADGEWKKISTHTVLGSSGGPGPKRKEGDKQIPEGFYVIDLWNPKSNFRLSMRVNYPNASDLKRSDPVKPGSDIYIHGKNVSIGCLAMGDEVIDELYILTSDVKDRGQAQIPIHFFPARMEGEAWTKLKAEETKHTAFWSELQPGYDAFEKTRRVPSVTVEASGAYRVAAE